MTLDLSSYKILRLRGGEGSESDDSGSDDRGGSEDEATDKEMGDKRARKRARIGTESNEPAIINEQALQDAEAILEKRLSDIDMTFFLGRSDCDEITQEVLSVLKQGSNQPLQPSEEQGLSMLISERINTGHPGNDRLATLRSVFKLVKAEADQAGEKLKQENAAYLVQIAKLRGELAKANRKLEEGGLEPEELEEDADARQIREYLPFERDILGFLNEPGSRAIHWIYSIIGALGKSRFTSELVTLFDALIIDPHAPKGALELIGKQKAKSAKFVSKPVLILDLPRSESVVAKKLYQVLESIQGSFSDSNGTMQWEKLPHVIVFANDTPETGALSADRLRVHLITKKHELVEHRQVMNELEAEAERLSLLQDQEEEAAKSGDPPPRQLERRARGVSGAGSSSGADGHQVPTLRTLTLI